MGRAHSKLFMNIKLLYIGNKEGTTLIYIASFTLSACENETITSKSIVLMTMEQRTSHCGRCRLAAGTKLGISVSKCRRIRNV